MKKRIVAFVILPLLLVASLLVASNATAGVPVKFRFHVSNLFIQTGTEIPQTGARAQDTESDDIVSVTGRGRFNSSSGKAGGGGAFVHTNSAGDLVGYGTWRATSVESLDFWGCGQFPDGTPTPAPNFCGGQVTLNVQLTGVGSEGAASFPGQLVINCLIGANVPEGAEEGITLDIGVISFDDLLPEMGGLTLFLSRP